MNRLIVIFVLFTAVILFPGQSNAATIDLIAQSYSIWGYSWPIGSYSFSNQNSQTPVTNTPGFYGSSVVDTYATGDIGASSAILGAGFSMFEYGQSSAEIRFRADKYSFVDILVDAEYTGADAWWYVDLIDSTTGNTLISLSRGGDFHFSGSFSIPVESAHSYILSDRIVGLGGDGAYAKASMIFTTVPEPTSMLLIGLGLIGLLSLESRRH